MIEDIGKTGNGELEFLNPTGITCYDKKIYVIDAFYELRDDGGVIGQSYLTEEDNNTIIKVSKKNGIIMILSLFLGMLFPVMLTLARIILLC